MGVHVRRVLFVLILFLGFFSSGLASASVFDPGAGWTTIETKHFRVHFPERIEDVARRSARILEEIYPGITEKWNWDPWSYTEVVLIDNTDDSNGLSSVLPYNWMLIFVTPPPPDSSLAHYDDWLQMLLVHEFTHIVQIDAVGGFWRPIRAIVGKTVAPSGIDPTWMREGISQYDETVMTAGGRGRGSYSEMIVRTAVLADKFPPIDEADGLSWRWPGYKSAYIYGIKFLQYLIETYGEESFLEFDRRVRSSPLLGMINHQARGVYGKTFYELWREWQQVLIDRYARESARIEAAGLTPTEPVVESYRDQQYEEPTISPDGTRLAYVMTWPHGKAEIRVRDLATGEEEVIRKGQEASQLAWSRDGTKLAYSAMGSFKRYNRYYDIWLYDFDAEKKKNRVKKLTSGERGRDPDFDPNGASLIFIAGEGGTDRLKRVDIETKEITTLTPDVPRGTQLANPRFSPDGCYIAVSAWRPGDGWRIYRGNRDGTAPLRLTRGTGLVVESRPAWTPDGRFILFASDESGIGNIYRVPTDGGQQERITNTITGLFQPFAASDGKVYAQSYSVTGFEIASFIPPPAAMGGGKKQKGARGGIRHTAAAIAAIDEGGPASNDRSHITHDRGGGGAKRASVVPIPDGAYGASTDTEQDKEIEAAFKPRKYVAFGHSLFLPRFLAPNFGILDNAVYLSLMTGGADPLRWQNWLGGATYRTDANFFGYFFQYWYNRYLPLLGASVNEFAVDFGNITFITIDNLGNQTRQTVHFFEKRRALNAFIVLPIKQHSFRLSYFYEDHMPLTSLTAAQQGALNLGKFAGFRGEYRYGDAERYPASISPENGRAIRLTGSITNRRLGSDVGNEQVIFSGDWREFIRLWRHNVLALRAGGGITWGDRLVQGTFGLGGAMGEGAFGGGGSYNYFPLRGLPVSAFSRTRAMLFSGEYRFPILNTLRGIGTVPFFLKDISGALFADYGNAWNAHEGGCDSFRTFFSNFMLSVGLELRGDFIIGHGLPIHGRLGYGIVVVNRDRVRNFTDPILKTSVEYGSLILALGAAF